MLCRCYFIVLCFGQYILHIGPHPLPNGAEIMILQLLTLWRLGAKQCTAGKQNILPLIGQRPVYQEIFLFRSHRCRHAGHICLAQDVQKTDSLFV